MPDKWEYPWYAAWDLAFHMIPFARIDPAFAKQQLLLLLREWYMHPNGQLPAYEFALGDVNPPVHAWAAWRIYKIAVGPDGQRDRDFLARVFQKLLLNFTWWVNRKDADGKNIFSGGFLGLDNIGVFDRSKSLPTGGTLEQADGTAWMAFYSATMLSMALELARLEPAYEDMASKFFEHFVGIADAINTLGGSGLWDEGDGFYYDELHAGGQAVPLRVRSMVGLLPLIAAEVLEEEVIDQLPAFKKRMQWFLDNRRDLASQVSFAEGRHQHLLLAIPVRARLERVLGYLLDEAEFLSPFGIRSLSRVHERSPYRYFHDGQEFRVDYDPARVGHRPVRGQQQLARAGLVAGQLPADRGAGALPPLLRRPPAGGAARRFGPAPDPEAGGRGAGRPAGGAVPARARRRPALPRRRRSLPGRPPLSRPAAVPRVLPPRDRPGPGGQPPDRLDRPGDPLPGGRRRARSCRGARAHLCPAAGRTPAAAGPRAPGRRAAGRLTAPQVEMSGHDSEWLEADGLGGFASGPVVGPRTRRYHALLLASTAAAAPASCWSTARRCRANGGRPFLLARRLRGRRGHPGAVGAEAFPRALARWRSRCPTARALEPESGGAGGASPFCALRRSGRAGGRG